MQTPPYIASTYLRVLCSDDHFMRILGDTLGDRTDTVLNSELVYLDDIDQVFNAFASSGLQSWVLQFGEQVSVASHGALGFAVLSAPDLHTALSLLADYSMIRSSTYRNEFRHNGNRLEFISHDLTNNPLVGRWLIESGFSVAQQLIETIMTHPLGDNAVINFTYPEPSYKKALEAFYGTRCRFNANYNSLDIPASWCRIASPLSDPSTFKSSLQKCRELKLALQGNNDIVESVRLTLKNFFYKRALGHVYRHELPTLESLADTHNMSSRTLARRLKGQQESYKTLLEEARKAQALEHLRTTHLPIADIADQLAYQEPANFVRAFKTWFNTTPAAWRKNSL